MASHTKPVFKTKISSALPTSSELKGRVVGLLKASDEWLRTRSSSRVFAAVAAEQGERSARLRGAELPAHSPEHQHS